MLLEKYQANWRNDFQQIKDLIVVQLSGIDLIMEHVGSTAIPQLAAKPIIDIDLVYTEDQDFESIKSSLEDLGYYHNGDQGIAGREVFKRDPERITDSTLDGIKHHLYVSHQDSHEWKRHVVFRDFLREHEATRETYQALKFQIAEQAGQDRKTYAKLKEKRVSAFVESILEQVKSVYLVKRK